MKLTMEEIQKASTVKLKICKDVIGKEIQRRKDWPKRFVFEMGPQYGALPCEKKRFDSIEAVIEALTKKLSDETADERTLKDATMFPQGTMIAWHLEEYDPEEEKETNG